MFTEDMSVFFDAEVFGTSAAWGALTAAVLVNAPTEDVLGGRVSSNEYELIAPVSTFPGINRSDTITIAEGKHAGTYQVREKPKQLDDGALKSIQVTKV